MTLAAQKDLAAKALALPKKAREKLARQLVESLHPKEEELSSKEWSGAWKKEVNDRIADIESGKVKCIPYAEARKKLDRILGKA
jgi:putative addiction module component (TIGR02574 family)